MLPTIRAKSVFWAGLLCSVFVPGLCHFQPRALAIQRVYRKRPPTNRICRKTFRRIASQGGRASVLGRRRGTAKQRTRATSHSALRKGAKQRSKPEIRLAPLGGAVRRPGRQCPVAGRVQQSAGVRSQESQSAERLRILLLRAGKLRRSRAIAPQGPGDRSEPSEGALPISGWFLPGRGDSTRVSRLSPK